MYTSLWEHTIFSPLGQICMSGIARLYGKCKISFSEIAKLFSKVTFPFYIHTNSVWEFLFFHVLANPGYGQFVKFSLLRGVTWYLLVILICISPKTKDAEHLYMRLFAGYISSLVKYLFKCVAHLLNKDFSFYDWVFYMFFFIRYVFFHYFLQVCGLSFYSHNRFLKGRSF